MQRLVRGRAGCPGGRATRPDRAALLARGSSLTRAVADCCRDLNRSVLLASQGHLDLGALAGLGFLTAPPRSPRPALLAPPWFDFASWAFRTFTIFCPSDEGGERDDRAGADGGGA